MSMALRQIHSRYSRFLSNAIKIQKSISTTGVQKRHYFKNRECGQKKWFHNSKGVGFTLLFFTIGVSTGKWITVPFTERSHFVLFYKLCELGDDDEVFTFEDTLPPLHPDSIKAQKMYHDIIDQALPIETKTRQALEMGNGLGITIENEETRTLHMFKFVGKRQGELKKDKCEAVVVNSPKIFATSCGRFGKIYVSNALMYHYRVNDAMIATMIGHEVGHDLARHNSEIFSKFVSSVSVIATSLYLFSQSTYVQSKVIPFLETYVGRRHFLPSCSYLATVSLLTLLVLMKYCPKLEMEADYIGQVLMSSAGYKRTNGCAVHNAWS